MTDYQYDWRGRLTASRSPDGLVTVRELDNLGRAYRTQVYADLNGNYFTAGAEASELRGQSERDYDERGQVWRSRVYEVNPANGQVGDRLTSTFWYNPRGMLIKSRDANGLFQKSQYDGVGRQVASFIGFDAAEDAMAAGLSKYQAAFNVDGDTVIQQSQSIYDKAGNVIVSLSFQRYDNDTTSTGALTAANSYATGSVSWFDKGGRMTHSAFYGHERGAGTRYLFNSSGQIIDANANGIPDEAERDPWQMPFSDDYILSKVMYDAAGRVHERSDNLGRRTVFSYDALGRTTQVIENYVDGLVGETESDTDRTTMYIYDSAGRLWQQVAVNPKGDDGNPNTNNVENQVTYYLYESAISGAWVTSVIYPDSPDTTSAGADQVKFAYDRLGRKISSTDQRGVVHQYSFDAAGRLEADAVSSLGQSGIVDGTVRRIGYAYDDMGRVQAITSYNAASGGSVVNQVKFTYDGWGNVIKSEQAHDGAVGAGTPAVQYAYGDGAVSGEAKYVRLESVTYPNGRVVQYGYSSTGVGGALNRLASIGDGSSNYAVYTYLGVGTIVKIEYPAVSGGLTLSYGSAGNGYEGLDRFGQILEQKWTNGAGSTTLDHLTYTYDRNGNRLTKTNQLASSFSENYTYDGLNRLIDADRGGSNLQSWDLDSLGNWAGTTIGATSQTREHNKANEITSISGTWVDPTYDAAGNMISGPKAGAESTRLHYVYDGWNRMVKAYGDNNGQPGTLIATYEYDGQGRRIQKTVGSDTLDYYFSEQYQVIETRLNGDADPLEQWVYDIRYVDAPIVRFYDGNTDGDYLDASDSVLFVMQDANFNVTGIVSALTGDVVERYVTLPYGGLTILAGDFSGRSLSSFAWITGHQGLAVDVETGLVYNRARYLHTSIGRFVQRDVLVYVDGMNLYQYVRSMPFRLMDPKGMQATIEKVLLTTFQDFPETMPRKNVGLGILVPVNYGATEWKGGSVSVLLSSCMGEWQVSSVAHRKVVRYYVPTPQMVQFIEWLLDFKNITDEDAVSIATKVEAWERSLASMLRDAWNDAADRTIPILRRLPSRPREVLERHVKQLIEQEWLAAYSRGVHQAMQMDADMNRARDQMPTIQQIKDAVNASVEVTFAYEFAAAMV